MPCVYFLGHQVGQVPRDFPNNIHLELLSFSVPAASPARRRILGFIVKIIHFFLFFFPWRYNSLWGLVFSKILFHASLSTTILVQFWIFIFFQTRSHIILPSCPWSTNPSYCNWSPFCYSFHCPFIVHSYNMPIRIVLCAFIYLTVCIYIYIYIYISVSKRFSTLSDT
jgi:hypothetical protein